MKYVCELDGKVFANYDDAWDHVADWFTNDDFIDYAKKIGRFDEMMYDLMDHDTDLAQEIHGRAIEEFFKDNVSIDVDDEILEVMSERPHDILDELRRLDSPLFWEFCEIVKNRYLNECITENEEDEEDE